MWRYWELLTDKSVAEIQAMKSQDPMQVKMCLARAIVADFHSKEAAEQAQSDFDREVREGAAPADMESFTLPADIGNSLPKILVAAGLADSRTDAERKIKAGAVEIDGVRHTDLKFSAPGNGAVFHVGKKWKRIVP
ncbi:MAG TPA: S4 domain-containing protein [Bryobacteraceae bacterium]|nr:S4 domain-containing protein [Bryobacteraceae bacterium]